MVYPEIIIGPLHILDERGLLRTYHVAFLICIELCFTWINLFLPNSWWEAKNRELTPPAARLMTALCIKMLVHFFWLNWWVTKQWFISSFMATNRLLQPLSTDIFFQWTVFLILRNRAVAGEQLLCNNLPHFLCVSSWNRCLNSVSFVRPHWFCSSLESWFCTGLAYSWAKGYHAGLEFLIFFAV